MSAICRDPDDNKFLDCAIAGYADAVIAGDADLLTLKSIRGILILSPAAFMKMCN